MSTQPIYNPVIRQLICISGEFCGRAFSVDFNGTILGRDNVACQIVFSPSTLGISRHHCHVKFNPQTGMFVINDLGSTYGTYKSDGTRIISGQPIALRSGERFYLGSQNNTFEVR
jgi:hypothetical protein